MDMASKRMRLDGGVGDPPSEAQILALVAQREQLRQARRFQESDAIREELRGMGVELFDKEKEWRSKDGRRGTLFTAGPAECPLSDQQIMDYISQREEARKMKDWSRADGLRDQLRNTGVELDDKEGVWRTAGGRSGTYAGGVPAMKPQALGVQAIRKLVAERERLRAAMDFEAADELRRQLAQLGVELFDNERIWRSADGQQGVIITGGHEVECLLTDMDVAVRVAQREEARSQKDFGQADLIRDDLRRQGVELLDAQRIWVTTDGRQGTYQGVSLGSVGLGQSFQSLPIQTNALAGLNSTAQSQLATLLSAAAGALPQSHLSTTPSLGSLSISTASIISLVSGRERAREMHDWESADAIRADLRAHGVDVWDKEKVWRANDGRSGPLTKLP